MPTNEDKRQIINATREMREAARAADKRVMFRSAEIMATVFDEQARERYPELLLKLEMPERIRELRKLLKKVGVKAGDL